MYEYIVYTTAARDRLRRREARSLVSLANGFSAQSWADDGKRRVNIKSLIGVLSLEVSCREGLTILADGTDEREAVHTIADFLTRHLS